MERVQLGRGGPKVSRIGLGMWQASGEVWGDDVTDANCIAAIRASAEHGVNLVDTAEAYGQGHSEEVVGRGLAEVGRDRFVVATKLLGSHGRYDHVLRAYEGSLRRLGVDAIDVYQVHWPDPWEQLPLRHTMRALKDLQREGKIRHVGVSNFAVRDLEEALSHLDGVRIVSNQVRYSMLHREIEEEVLPYCRKEGIAVVAYSPLAQGALTGKYTGGRRPTDRVRSDGRLFREDNLLKIDGLLVVMREIAEAHDRTLGQVALNWLLRHREVVPIPGAKTAEQAAENAGAAGWSLTAKEIDRLDSALETLELDLF